MMAVRLALVLALAASTFVASCSLLVQFQDQPLGGCEGSTCDAGLPQDTSMGPEVGPDAMDSGAPEEEEAEAAPGHPPDSSVYAPCGMLANGYYCGSDGPNLYGYAGLASNLLHCVAGAIGDIAACDAGCLTSPSPFDDACNPCQAVSGGTFCASQFPAFSSKDADLIVQCQSGVAMLTVCNGVCTPVDGGVHCS
jgi:hypothetical protein